MPSCTPATTTTSHSRPLAACAVSSRTASPRSALGAIVSAGQLLARTRGRGRPRCARRAAGRRSGPPRRRAPRSRRGRGRPPRPAAAARVGSPGPGRRGRSPRTSARPARWPATPPTARPRPSLPARGGRARRRAAARPLAAGSAQRRSTAASSAGSRSASTSSSPDGRRSPAASASARNPWRSRRSAERVGPAQRRVQQRDRRLLVERCGIQRAPQQQQKRRHRRLQVQRQVLGVDHGRHAGRAQRPLQRRSWSAGRAHQHGHPRPRHAVHQVRRAQRVRDVGRLAVRDRNVRTSTVPGSSAVEASTVRCPSARASAAPPARSRRAARRRPGSPFATSRCRPPPRTPCGTGAANVVRRTGRRRGTRTSTSPGRRTRPAACRRRPQWSRSIWAGSVSASSST